LPGYSPQTIYPFAVNALLVGSQIWNIVYGGKYSFTLRIAGTFFAMGIILVLIPLLAHIGGAAGFWLTFLILFAFGIFAGIGQSAVFMLAGALPFEFIGAVMLGQGIAGISANILRALTYIIFPVAKNENNLFIGAFVYFLIGAVYMFICGALQFVLKKNEYAVFHLWQNPGFKPKWQDLSPLIASKSSESSPISPRLSRKAKPPTTGETIKSVIGTLKENLRDTQGLIYSITFIFLITLLLFPGTTADTYFKWINNMHLANSEGWYQLACVFLFNIFDTVGRYCGGKPALDLSIRKVNWGTISRVLFIATFLLTDFECAPQWLWNTDWFKILNLFLFAFTNGYLSTLCAIKSPGTVKESRRAIVGGYIGMFISLGCLLGSLLQTGMGPILALTPKQKNS